MKTRIYIFAIEVQNFVNMLGADKVAFLGFVISGGIHF